MPSPGLWVERKIWKTKLVCKKEATDWCMVIVLPRCTSEVPWASLEPGRHTGSSVLFGNFN